MVKTILLRGGTKAQHANFTGHDREITVETDSNTLMLHIEGQSYPMARTGDIPVKLSDITDNSGLWKKSVLTKVSQLTDDVGYWANLTKVSQLQNDLNWKTGHCTYCTHCTYCKQCSRCNQVQCNQVHCYQVKCSDCNRCNTIQCNCNCDCGDDSCFISGQIKTSRGMVDAHEIRVGDEIISFLGKAVPVVGVSHGHLSGRKAISMSGTEDFLVTDDHPLAMLKGRKLQICAAINGSFDPDKPIKAENGVVGKYSEHNDYLGYFLPMKNLSADTPTVCPITAEETIIKFGDGYVLVPGQIKKE